MDNKEQNVLPLIKTQHVVIVETPTLVKIGLLAAFILLMGAFVKHFAK